MIFTFSESLMILNIDSAPRCSWWLCQVPESFPVAKGHKLSFTGKKVKHKASLEEKGALLIQSYIRH